MGDAEVGRWPGRESGDGRATELGQASAPYAPEYRSGFVIVIVSFEMQRIRCVPDNRRCAAGQQQTNRQIFHDRNSDKQSDKL